MKKNYFLLSILLSASTAFGQAIAIQPVTADTQTLNKPKQLEEVIIHSGYFKETAGGTTVAVTHIKGSRIKNLPTQDIATAIQGLGAGIEVISASGEPGMAAQITIRGVSSLYQPAPLYIVDGMQQQNGLNMNLADIESIDVLKDAAACAIYGAAGAGGVIIITTKSGADSADE